MRRLTAFILIFALAVPFAFAQKGSKTWGPIEATAELAYMKTRNPDGSWTEVRGLELPITITPMRAKVVAPVAKRSQEDMHGPFAGMGGMFSKSTFSPVGFNQSVFQNDVPGNPNVGVIVGETVNSAIDDMIFTSATVGKPWKIVKFGVYLDTVGRTGKFLVRWRAYKVFTPGLGPGVMAFTQEMFDVGFYLERSQFPPHGAPPWDAFEVTIDFSLSPFMVMDQEGVYLAQQFRHPQTPVENGEGAFSATEWNCFCDNGPQIGDSEDLFYFDIEPDGVYDETEADQFEIPGAAVFYNKTEVTSGASSFLTPISFAWLHGTHTGGSLSALHFNNGVYMTARAGVAPAGVSPAELEVLAFSPTLSPAGIRFDVDSKVNTTGLEVRLYLYNWFTDEYDLIKTAPATRADSMVSGVTQFPILYVNEDSEIKAKVSFFRTGPIMVWPWTVSVDQTRWLVTE